MGGTTGALYSLMFMCAANEIAKDENSKQNWPAVWCRACSMGLTGMMRYSQAQLGDRTMVIFFAYAAFFNCSILFFLLYFYFAV